MGIYVTPAGLQKKTLTEIKLEREADLKSIFGENIDLDPEEPFGQYVGIESKRDADLWDAIEEIYTSRNINEASGRSLDNIASEKSIPRSAATATQNEDVVLFGDEATVVAEGSQARQANAELTYSLINGDVTITKTIARHLEIEPNTAFPTTGGETFSVTINGDLDTHVAGAGESKGDVIDAVVALIVAGSWTGTAENIDDANLRLTDDTADFSVTWSATFDLNLLGSAGTFLADEAGANTLPANTLDTIVTPVSGWDNVNNPIAASTGRAVETDDAYRIRIKQAALTGKATEEAIRTALLNDIENIISVTVTSNRKSFTQTQKVVFSDDFITGNNIDFMINGIVVTTVPFNTDHSTTMADIKTQIEADVSDSTVEIDTQDVNERTLLITVTILDIVSVQLSVTSGASQTEFIVFYTDVEGRPPHSVECVVEGGADADVAQVIWDNIGGGIQPYGNTSIVIQDSQGTNQTIDFSRPVPLYIHAKVKRDFNDEETYPVNGDDEIKQNIVDYSLLSIGPGDDVIRQRLNTPVYLVPGISDIEITIDDTPNPGDSPTLAEKNISITARQIAKFDVARIEVEILTP